MRYLNVTDSDTIKSIAYDDSEGHLKVVFKASPDTVYSYGCTPKDFISFINTASIGKAFHERFKKKPFTKSDREPDIKK